MRVKNFFNKGTNIIIFLCSAVVLVCSVLAIRQLVILIPLVKAYLSTEEAVDIRSSVVEAVSNFFTELFVCFIAVFFDYRLIRKTTKDNMNEAMKNALHSPSLKYSAYVSYDNNPFAFSIIKLLPRDCDVEKGLIFQILSNQQLFPIDYTINKIEAIAYDENDRPIGITQCFHNNEQIVICFDENLTTDNENLFDFIVDTFNLNRHNSSSPIIYLDIAVSYSVKKILTTYNCKFSVEPISGIDRTGRFDLKVL